MDNKLLLTTKDLMQEGVSRYKIQSLIEKGDIQRLDNRWYKNLSFGGDESPYLYVPAFSSKGVVCLLSAADYYGYTTYIPDSVDVAVPAGTKVLPRTELEANTMVRFHPFYFKGARYELGITKVEEGENSYLIYDREKTVLDIIKSRNKVGVDFMKEVLENYLASEERDLNKLWKYSTQLRCEPLLRTYMEVLV